MPRPRREIPWLEVRDAVYYVFWYADGRTNRLSLRTTDRMEAQQRYAAFLAEGSAIFSPSPQGLTVSHALADYAREHVAAKVVAKHRQAVAIRHLTTWFADTPLKDIDIPRCRQYAEARRTGVVGGGGRYKESRPGSEATVRRELGVLSAAAHHALRWKRITRNEAPVLELPPIPHSEARWLSQEEFRRLVDTATGRLKDFILVAYYTGGRRASVERLTKFQVDLKASRINLRGPDEDANQRRSAKRRPVVPIDPELRPTLERLMADSPTEWLFGEPRDMYVEFTAHAAAIGLDITPHGLRHSRATHLLQAGVSLYDVARLLGDTVATVERVYGHHAPDYLGETIRRRTG